MKNIVFCLLSFVRAGVLSVVFLLSVSASYASTAVWPNIDEWWGGPNWVVDGVADQNHPGSGNTTVINNGLCRKTSLTGVTTAESTYLLGPGGTFVLSQGWEIKWDDITISSDFNLQATYLRMGSDFNGATPSRVTMDGGTITLSDVNAFRGIGFEKVWFNLTGLPGDLAVVQSNNSDPGTALPVKIGQGYFRIDGVRVFETGVVSAVNGKYMNVETNGIIQTLTLEYVPGQTNVWQGGDDWWSASNWTIDGVTDQTIPGGNPVTYVNHAFMIGSGSLQRNGQVIIIGELGEMVVSNATLTVAGTSNYSAFNVNGNAKAVFAGNAAVNFSVNNNNNRTLGCDQGSLVVKDSAVLTVETELNLTDYFDFKIQDNASVSAGFVNMSTGNSDTSFFTIEGGQLTVSHTNGVRAASFAASDIPSNRINFTGVSGAVVQTDNSGPGTALADKLAAGFFCNDGEIVTEAGYRKGARYFELTEDGNVQTLTFVERPLGSLMMIR